MTETIAGVDIPDTELAREATELVRKNSTPLLFDHSRRVFLFATLKGRYRGVRVSFGYPACPNLADQVTLFRLLEPEGIGLSLTEGFMMDPEASVSAVVFHHPAARYFKAD